jgi:iron complex transport system substrate-binding protein
MKRFTRMAQFTFIMMLIALLAACGSNNNGNNEAAVSPSNNAAEQPANNSDDEVRVMKDAMGHEVQTNMTTRLIQHSVIIMSST